MCKLRNVSNTCVHTQVSIITLRPQPNGRHFADNMLKCIFVNGNMRMSIQISLKFVPNDPINNKTGLVQIMAWCRAGDKPLIWNHNGLVCWRMYASLGHDEIIMRWWFILWCVQTRVTEFDWLVEDKKRTQRENVTCLIIHLKCCPVYCERKMSKVFNGSTRIWGSPWFIYINLLLHVCCPATCIFNSTGMYMIFRNLYRNLRKCWWFYFNLTEVYSSRSIWINVLVQVMALYRRGNNPLFEPMMMHTWVINHST